MTPRAATAPPDGLATDLVDTWLSTVGDRHPPPSREQAIVLIAMSRQPTRVWRVGLARRALLTRLQILGWAAWVPVSGGWRLTDAGAALGTALDRALAPKRRRAA